VLSAVHDNIEGLANVLGVRILICTNPTVLLHVQCVQKHACLSICMVMPVMLDRITRTASLSASHSSPGLPPR
jgi:hypothetical protein